MKRIFLILMLLAISISLIACSSASGSTDAAPPAAATSSEPSTTEDTAELPEAGETTGSSETIQTSTSSDAEDEVARPEGWTEDSHGKDADPNYDVVFPTDKVNTITITIDPADWEAMQANMTDILGEPGTGGQNGPGGGFTPQEGMEPPSGEFTPPQGGEPPAGRPGPGGQGGFPGGGDMVSETPMWVPATIEFDGNVWNHVGVRYKGNSSLTSAWSSGTLKMPLKFDFDEFEDDYPEIDNQRFFGFKQLSLANGFSDDTYLRETLTYDAMREAGLVAGRTAFYEVVLDYGEGPTSLGIYTVVEVVDDTVIDTAFGGDDGNIYEGDGQGVSLAEGTYDLIADSFEKENNEDEADWSDIEALYIALHADTRTTDPEQWRADLEAIFDVDTFLNWLAVGAVVQNWDTYGAMNHNFYLYNNPETGQLVWIPWDHNMTFGVGMGAGRGGQQGEGMGDRQGAGMGSRSNVTFDKAEVDESWPLIRFLLDDPVYNEKYMGFLAEASALFDADAVNARIEEMAGMLRPFIIAAGEEEQFDAALQQLIAAVSARDTAAADFVATQ